MKISYKWLKRYLTIDCTPEKIAQILTDTGLEVEGLEEVESIKGGLKGVVIGEVLTCEKHENADRLNVTTVNIGGNESLQIVCGAPNVAAGQKVIVATVGTTLYPTPEEEFSIKKSKIRGVESHGMICAEDELGIGKSHDGIMVLPSDVKVGTPAADYFKLESDFVFEIGLTPNRNDAMGHIGVARDIFAYLNVHEDANLMLNWPSIDNFKVDNEELPIKVEVENPNLAPRYAGVTISNVTVQPSPDWLKNALLAIGLTPINNIVDVTNFVLHELGTPLHAFDAEKVGSDIVVKNANKNETFTTLDEVERKLSSEDLMITNGKDNLCIAGVFGGTSSGVTNETKSIFLEAAYFNPVSVRKTAKRHGLNTDASFRFERGIDPNLVFYALKRATLLIQEVAGGQVSMQPIDLYPSVVEPLEIEFNFERCENLLGNNIDVPIIRKIWKNLDIEVLALDENTAKLSIPTYRGDVTREADVIEEILRIYGFNRIFLPEKLNLSIVPDQLKLKEKTQRIVADYLVGIGCFELMNNSLTKEEYWDEFGAQTNGSAQHVRMLNPLSQELNVMRQSLLFQICEVIAHNQNRQNPDLRLFEFGKTYHKYNDEYVEQNKLLIAVSGRKNKESWNTSTEDASFYTLKGIIESLFERLGLSSLLKTKAISNSLLEDGLTYVIKKKKVAEIGWISSKMKKKFGIKKDVFIADINWDEALTWVERNKVVFTEVPKTFAMRRDFSLLLDKEVQFSQLEELAFQCDKHLLKQVQLFDVYEGDKLPENKKSYAVSFSFQDAEKTLKDEQIDKILSKIRARFEKELNAELR